MQISWISDLKEDIWNLIAASAFNLLEYVLVEVSEENLVSHI